MEDRRCWKLLVAVRSPPRGHSKTAKAMAAGDDDGDALWQSTTGAREGELSWRGWALWRGHMIYSRGLIAVSVFPFVLIFFHSVLILFPFARCHV